MKVMIVDDSKTARLFVRKSLLMAVKNLAVDVVEADSGESAFKILCSDSSFDLLLTDVNMPEMSGFTFMHNLRLNSKLLQIPVVFITSLSNESNKHNLMELGAFSVISKPVSVGSLETILQELNLITPQAEGESEWGV